ncbi:hypothetical protein L288_20285 [Sphingobium quisquiliarum P25]|uniref:Luciferase-like domain-containing protein n=1 Tax=Sphingobium quisquiliarum P25 TaxID=1329909 RepID=T0HH10_9SPHN|nr:LLM class flavin-dependent oxidoreductase [Sphingobium quisquiliarum]EQA98689.1 hypothetical protein L288_20285 [Sphingobium quisquiliarum P25]
MTIEFVGMINPSEWTETRPAARAQFDIAHILRLSRAHEEAGFDRVLVTTGGGVDGLQLAAFAAAHTDRLGFMIAHRPGSAPSVAARTFATLDHLSQGRIRLHAVTGITEEPEDGDTLSDKASRYARTDEYLEIVRRLWTEDAPFDFEGRFYKLRGAFSPVKPFQKPQIPVSFGGSSEHAYQVGVKHADLYGIWGEPLEDTRQQIAAIHAAAKAADRPAPRISLSVRLILGATEDVAWDRAHRILAAIEANPQFGPDTPFGKRAAKGTGGQRLLAAAARGDRHDRALWMPTAVASGAYGDTTALVGTPETVVAALLDYVELGVTTFINRGYDPYYDAVDYGRWLIPAVRAEVAGRRLSRRLG